MISDYQELFISDNVVQLIELIQPNKFSLKDMFEQLQEFFPTMKIAFTLPSSGSSADCNLRTLNSDSQLIVSPVEREQDADIDIINDYPKLQYIILASILFGSRFFDHNQAETSVKLSSSLITHSKLN